MSEQERIKVKCSECGEEYTIKYDDYGDPEPQIHSAQSCGVYASAPTANTR